MTSSGARTPGPGLLLAVAVTVALLVLAVMVRVLEDDPATAAGEGPTPAGATAPGAPEATEDPQEPAEPAEPAAPGATPAAPRAGSLAQQPPRFVFGNDRTLVAYYGTAGSGSLGVLGEGTPDRIIGRLTRAADAFARPDRPVQVVFELIVTIADATPGPDGDYSHDIARSEVERYVRAARRHDALLLLDLQPGRASFVDVARRWEWALRDPRVGLALDLEWRMGRHEVPGRVIGSVDAAEVNEVSLWLANIQRRLRLPQKLFVLHQFRTSMIGRIDRVAVRDRLATVQHVDGFGTPEQKLGTYRAVLRADRFRPGFKLFYDEDVRLMRPADVLRIKPRVRFVSYQ